MKWMRWFLVLAVGVGVALGTIGCGGSDDDGGNPLVGTWKADTYNGQALDPSAISVVATFRSNGTASTIVNIGGQADTSEGTWSAENGTLTVTSEGETDSSAYSISGDTLTISDEQGTFTLKRQ